MANRATPEKHMIYKLSLQLYKTFNDKVPITEWILLNTHTILTSKQTTFKAAKFNRL